MQSPRPFAVLNEEFKACEEMMFERYDIDASGTLNSSTELLQLCTNLCIKLGLVAKMEIVEQLCTSVPDLEADPWDRATFAGWFKEAFLRRYSSDGGEPEPISAIPVPGKQGPLDLSQTFAGHANSGPPHVPPGSLYNHQLPDDEDYCWCMFFPNEEHERHKPQASSGDDLQKMAEIAKGRDDILRRMRRAGLSLKKELSADGDELIVTIGAPQRFLEFIATQIRIPVKLKPNDAVKGTHGYMPFDMMDSSKFMGLPSRDGSFKFRTKPRLQIVAYIIQEQWNPEVGKFGAGLDPPNLIKDGVLKKFFPKHGALLDNLRDSWARFGLIFPCCNDGYETMWNQPIDMIRDYFGERLAMYFSFVGFYTKALLSPTLWGIVCGALVYAFPDTDANPIGSWAVVAYCAQVVVWATILLENWKRQQTEHAHHWGMRGLDDKEQPLPAFQGVYDSTLETLVYDDTAGNSRSCQVCIGSLVVITLLLSVAGSMVLFTFLTELFQRTYEMGYIMSTTQAVAIIVFNELYKQLASWLTELENHRTETEFQNSLTVKCFLFQFINSYFALYIVAFVKPWAIAGHDAGTWNGILYNATDDNFIREWFGSCTCATYLPDACYDATECVDTDCSNWPSGRCECTEYQCRADVASLLITVFGIQILVGNFLEIFVPLISARITAWTENGMENQSKLNKSAVEIEAEMADYEAFVYAGLFDDYNEIALQFGFVTLFATNFPFVGCLAFLNNMIEIRSDAYKFCNVYRRPTPRPAEGIGAWYMVMEVMTFAAVTTNCANVFTVSDFAKDMSWSVRVIGLFAAEHAAYLIKLGISLWIPDVKEHVQKELDYEECMKERAILGDLLNRVNQDFSDELGNYRPGGMNKDVSLDEVPYEADVCLFDAPLMVLAPGAAGKVQAEAIVNARAAKAIADANPIAMPATDQEEVVCIVAEEPTGEAIEDPRN